MDRRQVMAAVGLAAAWRVAPAAGEAGCDLALAWAVDGRQWAGVLRVDPAAGEAGLRWQHPLPGRAHGLLPLPGGGLLVLAARPGRWLLRLSADGRAEALHRLDQAGETSTLGGHAALAADGHTLFTTETAPGGAGRIGVRDRFTLRRLADWDSGGLEPHHLLHAGGRLWVAHGGIRRGEDDRKLELARMDSTLVALDAASGRLLLQERLPDRRLSLRHLAAATGPGDGRVRIGVALQAEHDDPRERAAAPVLAVHDQGRLVLPPHDGGGGGYAGDIAPAAGGGFVVSCPKAHRAWGWRPGAEPALAVVAELREVGALATWPQPGGATVLLAAARGLGAWHPARPPRLLRWPQAMALDNHACVLDAGPPAAPPGPPAAAGPAG